MNIRDKNFLLEALFENVSESIIVADQKGEILLVNPATNKMFGYSQGEIVGQKIEFLIPDRLGEKHVESRNKYNECPISRAMGVGLDLMAKRNDSSEFPVEISLTPFNTSKEIYVIAFILDITKRRLAELEIVKNSRKLENLTVELKATNEMLESKVHDRTRVLSEAMLELEKSKEELKLALDKEKELNELKSRFLSMTSHEFRTPLTAILSSATLITEYSSDEQNDKRLKHINRIKSAVNNLNDILSDFLSISKIEEGRVLADFHAFNLQEHIEELIGELKGILKVGQSINFNFSGNSILCSDKKLVRNILINLISNSIKFSDEDKVIDVSVVVDSARAIIKVQDSGIGISDEDKKHLFERFFRGKNALNIQGTGLGLNIVSNYIEFLDGFIEMESQLDLGTTFTVTLPNKN